MTNCIFRCRIATSVYQSEGRVTVAKLADLGRGLGGGNFTSVVTGQGKKRRKAPATENVGLDLEEVCGGKLTISKDVSTSLFSCRPQNFKLIGSMCFRRQSI